MELTDLGRVAFFCESQLGVFLKWKSSSFVTEICLVEILKCENFWLILFRCVGRPWPFLSSWFPPFLSDHLPNGCRRSSSNSSLFFGISVWVEIGLSVVFWVSVEIVVVGGGVSLRCSCLIASISPVSIALYSSSVNVKNSETDRSCTYASALYSFWMVVIFAGGVWLINFFSGTGSAELQPEVILTRQ